MAIFDNPIFLEMILPFLLVFVIIFALLQKSEILGKGKAQIDALVGLVIALILIVFPVPRDIIVNMMPWLAVAVMVIFIFLLLYSMTGGNWKHKWVQIVIGLLAGAFVVGLVLTKTGLGDTVKGWFSGGGEVWTSIIILVVVGGALALAISTGKKSDDGKSED